MNTSAIPTYSSIEENIRNLEEFNVDFFIPHQNGYVAFALLASIAGVAFFFVLCSACKSEKFDATKRLHLIGIFFFFTGSLLLAVFNERIQKNLAFEYRGLMRIKDYDIDVKSRRVCTTTCDDGRRRLNACYPCPCNTKCDSSNKHEWLSRSHSTGSSGSSSCKKKTTNCRTITRYDVHLEVEWGLDWGCPDTPATLCSSTVIYSPCTNKYSSNDARECMNSVFDPSINKVEYDAQSPPSLDVQWPSVVLYGDCNSCSARYSVPDAGRLWRVKISGSVLSTLGVFLIAMPWFLHYAAPGAICVIRKFVDFCRSVWNNAVNEIKEKKNKGGKADFRKSLRSPSSIFTKTNKCKKSKMSQWEEEVTMSVSEKSDESESDTRNDSSLANDMELTGASDKQTKQTKN